MESISPGDYEEVDPQENEPSAQGLSPEQIEALKHMWADPEKVCRMLSPEEREEYQRAQQSVVDARNSAQRHAGEIWIF